MFNTFDILYKHNITPNGWMVMTWIKDRIQRVDFINDQTEKYRLEKSGYIELDKSGFTPIYKLTKKGEGVLEAIEKKLVQQFGGKNPEKPNEDLRKEIWLPRIKEYNELWPLGCKVGTSVSFRCNENELFERFLWFFSEYPKYTFDDVIDAAKKYVTPFHLSMDFQYLQLSKYYIKKEDKNKITTSNLADMIYNVKDNNMEEEDDGTYYFGPQ